MLFDLQIFSGGVYPSCATSRTISFFLFLIVFSTAWCSEIGSLTSQDASEFHASSDVREPISLHQAVLIIILLCTQSKMKIVNVRARTVDLRTLTFIPGRGWTLGTVGCRHAVSRSTTSPRNKSQTQWTVSELLLYELRPLTQGINQKAFGSCADLWVNFRFEKKLCHKKNFFFSKFPFEKLLLEDWFPGSSCGSAK